jgi:outer membrane biosynthesis protein TonB
MFKFEKSDFQRFVVSSVGAVAVSSAFLLAAAGPAKAASPAAPVSTAEWQKQVERQISDSNDNLRMIEGSTKVHKVTLAARFTADGDYAGAAVASSSGNLRLDRTAVRIASQVNYPTLPAAYRGQPQTVTMRLFFGNDAAQVARAVARTPVQFAFNSNAGGTTPRTVR